MKITSCAALAAVVALAGCMSGNAFNPDENVAVSPDGKNEIRLYSNPLAYEVVRDGRWTVDYVYDLTSGIYSDLDGNGVITGMGSQERATTIAAKIQSGALPLELTQQKVDKVSATLGQDAVSTSVRAAMIGILLIMLLMILRYRLNGLIASWALTIYTILLFMLIALFGIQLTLPGLAGVVLGIGMAVDANVIIFERFNEEIRKGRSAKAAVRAGFKNAISAILDANVTTLIAAIVLLFYGTGSIQGFAKTLLLGVVVSMFTAVIVTRFLMNRFVNAGATNTSLYTKVKAEAEKEVEA